MLSVSALDGKACLQRVSLRANSDSASTKDALECTAECFHVLEGVTARQRAPLKAICVVVPGSMAKRLSEQKLGKELHEAAAEGAKDCVSKRRNINSDKIDFARAGGKVVKNDTKAARLTAFGVVRQSKKSKAALKAAAKALLLISDASFSLERR